MARISSLHTLQPRFLLIPCLIVMVALRAQPQSVLLGVNPPPNLGAPTIAYYQFLAQQLTLTTTVTVSTVDVAIQGPTFIQGSGQFLLQLTNAVGPGTTTTNVLAQQLFSFPPADTVATFVMSAGMILNPGTYYLVVSSTSNTAGGGWPQGQPLPSTVGVVGKGFVCEINFCTLSPSFPPASGVFNDAQGAFNFQVIGTGGGFPQFPDLSITSIEPVQVVFNADVNNDGQMDLVNGKPTSFRVAVNVQNPQLLDAAKVIGTRLTFQAQTFFRAFAKQNLDSQGNVDLVFEPLIPSAGGRDQVVQVDTDVFSAVQEAREDNNSRSTLLAVKDTRPLYVAYMRVDCFGQLMSYEDTVKKGEEFLLALYPVAPNKFTNQRLDSSIVCAGDSTSDTNSQWLNTDANRLWLHGKLLTNGRADRIVGIADPNWAKSRMPGANGITWCGSNRAFVLDSRWDTVSHEIGHTFQLSHPADPPNKWCQLSPGVGSTNGRWVDKHNQVLGVGSLMAPATLPSFSQPNRWMTRDDYERVFATFRVNPNDPEVLLVSGTLFKDGQIALSSFYRLPGGILDDASPGKFSVRVIGQSGQILYDRPFDIKFLLMLDPPVDTDAEPFGFAVPYPQEATTVEVQQNGHVLAQVRIATKLLSDAVASIPDGGFMRNPSQLRNALQNKINAFDLQLFTGDLIGAQGKLKNDIRKHLVDWLVDGYTTNTPLEYTKPAILGLADELLQRLGVNKGPGARHIEIGITLLGFDKFSPFEGFRSQSGSLC